MSQLIKSHSLLQTRCSHSRASFITTACLLGLVALPVPAQLTFEAFWLSSDVTVRVPEAGGSSPTIANDRSQIVINPNGSGQASIFSPFTDLDGTDIDAFDRFTTRYSIDMTREINGVLIEPGDVFSASGSNPPNILFDADAAGIPDGVNLDGVTQNPNNGNLVVSFDRLFADATVGFIGPGDLVEVSGGLLSTLVFSGRALPDGVNVDAAHWLTPDIMLLSFDVDAELPSAPGTQVFRDDDIVTVDLVSGSFYRVFSLANDSHPSWIPADLDALWAELVVNVGAIQFATSFREVSESVGTLDVTVNRIDGTETAVQARVTSLDGTATAGNDFNAVNEVLSWANGDDSSRTVTVTIVSDTAEEDNPERFSLQLAVESGEADLASPSTVQINILDNDAQNLFSDGFES